MKTTLDIPPELLHSVKVFSGKKNTGAAIRWAMEQAVRRKALKQFLAREVKVHFEPISHDGVLLRGKQKRKPRLHS